MSDAPEETRKGLLGTITQQINVLRGWFTPRLPAPSISTTPPPSTNSAITDKRSSITYEEAHAVVVKFWKTYLSARDIKYFLGTNEVHAYGGTANPGKITRGLFYTLPNGENHIRIALCNARDAEALTETLNHEVLGHWALNTLDPTQKHALLERIIAAKEQPVLNLVWRAVDYAYDGRPDITKAEEVYSILAESFNPQEKASLADASEAWQSAVVNQTRSLSIRDLIKIQSGISVQIRDGQRVQRTFPARNTQEASTAKIGHRSSDPSPSPRKTLKTANEYQKRESPHEARVPSKHEKNALGTENQRFRHRNRGVTTTRTGC